MLYVKCKTCGEEFASGLSIPKTVIEKVPLTNTLHRCSKGHEHHYDKADHSLFFLYSLFSEVHGAGFSLKHPYS